jgi:hypothetical protein
MLLACAVAEALPNFSNFFMSVYDFFSFFETFLAIAAEEVLPNFFLAI